MFPPPPSPTAPLERPQILVASHYSQRDRSQSQEDGHPWPLGRMTRWYLWACFSSTVTLEFLFWLRDRRARRLRSSDRPSYHVEAYAQFLKQV